MDNLDLTLGIVALIGAVIGSILGIIAQYFFNKQADKKHYKLALINLKGRIEGILLRLVNNAKDFSTAEYSFYHCIWQEHHLNEVIPDENKVPNSSIHYKERMFLKKELMVNELSELRNYVSEFTSISNDTKLRLHKIYQELQNHEPYNAQIDKDENPKFYLQNPFSLKKLTTIRKFTDDEYGQIYKKLLKVMDKQIQQFDKKFFVTPKVKQIELYRITEKPFRRIEITKYDNGMYEGNIYDDSVVSDPRVDKTITISFVRLNVMDKSKDIVLDKIKEKLLKENSKFCDTDLYFEKDKETLSTEED